MGKNKINTGIINGTGNQGPMVSNLWSEIMFRRGFKFSNCPFSKLENELVKNHEFLGSIKISKEI